MLLDALKFAGAGTCSSEMAGLTASERSACLLAMQRIQRAVTAHSEIAAVGLDWQREELVFEMHSGDYVTIPLDMLLRISLPPQ